MYAAAKTWNPYKGCHFDCIYCRPSFQKQAKRQKNRCKECYDYKPHRHNSRLNKIPSAEIIFVCGNADISFCNDRDYIIEIIRSIKEHNKRCPYKTYYFQSKKPGYFKEFLTEFPANVVLLTTLETNRDAGYENVSKAPIPSERYKQFLNLDYSRKVVTIEPLMDFDVNVFSQWIIDIKPEYVWLGLNSRPSSVSLPEPSAEKLAEFVKILVNAGVQIRPKELRGLDIGLPVND